MTLPLTVIGSYGVLAGIVGSNPATLGMFGVLAIPGIVLTTGLIADILHPKDYHERDTHIFGGLTLVVGVLGIAGIGGFILVFLNAKIDESFFGISVVEPLTRDVAALRSSLVASVRRMFAMVPNVIVIGGLVLSVLVMVFTKLVGGSNLSEDVGLLLRGDLDLDEAPILEL
ncbi:hypothetical protein ACFPYI_14125 [Halomarina salina]|uniref:DUF996 domain-containing protein n=1 Tax=Halomarina salina TaxID=1872699 RepID=A0ABD5RQ03_9EURY|nr:hypothetical protein [Halomarina salina]